MKHRSWLPYEQFFETLYYYKTNNDTSANKWSQLTLLADFHQIVLNRSFQQMLGYVCRPNQSINIHPMFGEISPQNFGSVGPKECSWRKCPLCPAVRQNIMFHKLMSNTLFTLQRIWINTNKGQCFLARPSIKYNAALWIFHIDICFFLV